MQEWNTSVPPILVSDLRPLMLGLFHGAMGVMVLHNLAIAVITRDRAWSLYVFFVSSLALSMAFRDGLFGEALPPQADHWTAASAVMLDALAWIAAVAFTRHYLDSGKRTPLWDRVLVGVHLGGLALFVFAWLPSLRPARDLDVLLSTLGAPAILVAGVLCRRTGYRPATVHLLAVSVFLAGALSATLADQVDPTAFWARHGLRFGALSMVILFSLGLTDRYQQALRGRERAEAENRMLQALSFRDALTGLWNRRRFDEQIRHEWARAARDGRPLALMIIDVDEFKLFNDAYGHQAGDACLRRVAQAMRKRLGRASDFVARYGGEEFVVILPGAPRATALLVAEALRAAVSALRIPHARASAAPHVTISLGIAVADPALDGDPALTIKAADAALYAAKAAGRNRVAAADGVTSPSRG